LRILIAESEPPAAREKRRASVGCSSGETYLDVLRDIVPDADFVRARPVDAGEALPDAAALAGYDAVFLSGSPLHLYDPSDETQRLLAFMRAVFSSGTPSFGSCAGLQVATVAAGGTVRKARAGHEAGFARRLSPTDEGRAHPLLAGRPRAYDAPAIHSDEVGTLPKGATLLASNPVTRVQAAEIRCEGGVFWGVQYHPEISLAEVAAALRREADDLVGSGLAGSHDDLEAHAGLIDALHQDPERRDIAWRLGLNEEVTCAERRRTELRNFIRHLVEPTADARRMRS
jgi:GMP synthase (glutamine-hydrolysing)